MHSKSSHSTYLFGVVKIRQIKIIPLEIWMKVKIICVVGKDFQKSLVVMNSYLKGSFKTFLTAKSMSSTIVGKKPLELAS